MNIVVLYLEGGRRQGGSIHTPTLCILAPLIKHKTGWNNPTLALDGRGVQGGPAVYTTLAIRGNYEPISEERTIGEIVPRIA